LRNPVVPESQPPAVLERAALVWRQSSAEDLLPGTVEDRIRRVFHLDATDPLPLVGRDALRDYHAHLAAFLSFPFRASYWKEAEPFVPDSSVIAIGLCDPARTPLDSATGILCDVVFRNAVTLPLALLKVDPGDPHCQLVDDYWHWFWNCR
jgi:hypothetical protein